MSDLIILGGYDAKTCPEATRKKYDPSYADTIQDPIPPGDQARMDNGVKFEAVFGDEWEALLGDRIGMVPVLSRETEDKKKREEITRKFMDESEKEVIWNARLETQLDGHRVGEPDALILAETSTVNAPKWRPVDVKDHRSLEGTAKSNGVEISKLDTPMLDQKVKGYIGDGTLRKSDALQLAHYHRMLEAIGMADEPVGGIIGREKVIVWHRLDAPLYRHPELGKVSALEYYDHEFQKRIKIAEAAKESIALTGPEWKQDCKSCIWRTSCHDELKHDLDHVTLLAGMTPIRAKAHYAQGITKRIQLARLSWKAAKLVDSGIDVPSLQQEAKKAPAGTATWKLLPVSDKQKKTLQEASILTSDDVLALHAGTLNYAGTDTWNLPGMIDQARVSKVEKVHLARGVNFVHLERCAVEEDIDIEDENGYVYLIGVRTSGRKKQSDGMKTRSEYHGFCNWDRTPEGEARVFAEFWEHIQGMRAYARSRHYGYRVYHYTHHEVSSFRELARRHKGYPGVPTMEELNELMDSKEFVDLYPILSQQLIWPTESVTLKDVAKWIRFSWRDTDPGGGNSLAWFADAVGDGPEAKENQQRLLEYNDDDCHAQAAIRDWLTMLGESRAPGKKLPRVEELDKRFNK